MSERNKSGSALVLVVGMLALMVTLTVTFSVYMRTEQLAAGSCLNDVIARKSLETALSRAISHIEQAVGEDSYPQWDVLASPGGATFSPYDGPATNWIPWGAFVRTPTNDLRPHWMTAGTVTGFESRIAYAIFNCSGLLDANFAGGEPKRKYGSSPSEIQVAGVSDADMYRLGRPYSSMYELKLSGACKAPMYSLVTYSAFPNTYEGGTNRTLVDISGTNLTAHALDISQAFSMALPGEDGNFLYKNLVDYVDEDDVPQDLGSPCTEAVPMVNEVRATAVLGEINLASNTCTAAIQLGIEWYYPFVRPTTKKYSLIADVEIKGEDALGKKYFPDKSGIKLKYEIVTPQPGNVKMEEEQGDFVTEVSGCAIGDLARAKVKIGVQVKNAAGDVVDSVPYPYESVRYFEIPLAVKYGDPSPSDAIVNVRGYECIDPRFNWDVSDEYWFGYPDDDGIVGDGSPNAVNKIVGQLRTVAKGEVELWPDMHVANEPLRNIGELSYLVRGKSSKWSTIKIMDDQRDIGIDRVLDYFVLGTNAVRRGLLNPNSMSVDAWADLLYGMPLDRYPGEASSVLDSDQAMAIARVMTNVLHGGISRISDVGVATNFITDIGISSASDFCKRSVIRNISSLIDVRQQYFVVLLYGLPVPTQDKGDIPSIQAIAEIWRDPIAKDGTHPKFIRSYTIMDQ